MLLRLFSSLFAARLDALAKLDALVEEPLRWLAKLVVAVDLLLEVGETVFGISDRQVLGRRLTEVSLFDRLVAIPPDKPLDGMRFDEMPFDRPLDRPVDRLFNALVDTLFDTPFAFRPRRPASPFSALPTPLLKLLPFNPLPRPFKPAPEQSLIGN